MVAATSVLFGVVPLPMVRPDGGSQLSYALFLGSAWAFIAAGLLAWWRRPDNRMGLLITLGGVALWLGSLAETESPPLIVIGLVFATSVLAVLVHLLHAFPSGRLRGGFSRAVVIAGYIVAIVLQVPLYLLAPSPLSVVDDPVWFGVAVEVQRISGALVMVATAVILVSRLRRAEPAHRRRVLPLLVYGIAAILSIPLSATFLDPSAGVSSRLVETVQIVVVTGVPVAFSIAVIRGGFTRTGVIEELAAQLGTVGPGRLGVTAALANALGDPSARIVYRSENPDGYTDEDGNAVGPPVATDKTAVSIIRLDGRVVGAIVYDARMIADAQFVEQAGRVAAIAIDRQRLIAELRRSRVRLLQESDSERHRIARDLHDGLQAQLVLLALQAQQLAQARDLTGLRADSTRLRESIDEAASELRRLVLGIMPASLEGGGLVVAIEDLVDRMPLPTRLEMSIGDASLTAIIQRTVYFVVAEGLSNVVKHSSAHSCIVRIERTRGILAVEVADDGIGDARLEKGTGLRGIADRVDVSGGVLSLVSPPGGGTTMRAELPCES